MTVQQDFTVFTIMFDTIKNQFSLPEIPTDFTARLPLGSKDIKESVQYHDGTRWLGWQWTDPALGAMGVKENRVGRFFWFERSLPKFMYGSNERVLSQVEAVEAMELLTGAVLGVYAPLFESRAELLKPTVKLQRLDVCYQKQVPCAQDVFVAMARSLKSLKVVRHQYVLSPPLQLHLTGVTFKQSMKELARWYDKGLESGNESYDDVVRHEEQLRGSKAQAVANWNDGRFVVDRDAALHCMNRRYAGLGPIKTFDMASFLRENRTHGAAAVGLVLEPMYEATYKQGLGESTYYRIKRVAEQARKMMHGIDLSLPEDAWREPMVL
jgi:hypothetical protein